MKIELERGQKTVILRILAAVVLFIAALLLPLQGAARSCGFLIPYLLLSYDVIWEGITGIFHGELLGEELLMTVASIGALILGDYPEAVMVMALFQTGELMEDIAVDSSRRSIESLTELRPDTASVIRGGVQVELPAGDVAVGERIVVRPGERIPLDGVIEEGDSSLDTSAMTGESVPRTCRPGDEVLAGCINISSPLTVRVSRTADRSAAARILELVESASGRKSRAEQFVTVFAGYYTPAVFAGAVLLALIPSLILGEPSVWIRRALIFLMISCPCALVISVPLSYFCGVGAAAKRGILVKGANYLEALAKIGTVVFDKTGTLTEGSFEVTAIHPEVIGEDELLELAAAAEQESGHPIALSIRSANKRQIDREDIENIREIPGKGVTASYRGHAVAVGSPLLMEEIGAKVHPCSCSGTVIHVSRDGEYMGHIRISDTVKPEAKETVARLKKLGVSEAVMLTGDIRETGENVAAELGLDEAYCSLLPEGKLEVLETLLEKLRAESGSKRTLAFVGDGVNDSPVLTRADVGIAMGALGSDAAVEASDVILTDDRLSGVTDAVVLARRTSRIVRENVAVALICKAVFLILGAFGLTSMGGAVFADVGVSILATLNALRAGRYFSPY